jgi:hypothetical protein
MRDDRTPLLGRGGSLGRWSCEPRRPSRIAPGIFSRIDFLTIAEGHKNPLGSPGQFKRACLLPGSNPISHRTSARAEDAAPRRASLEHLRRRTRDPADAVDLFGDHDVSEFPGGYRP